jgi:hypothetical protein
LNPEYRKKFFTKKRTERIQASTRKTYREDPARYELALEARLKGGMKYYNSLTESQKSERRKSLSRIAKERGYKPQVRRGNGTGPTASEQVLINLFPYAKNNFPVRTGKRPGSGYPTCYKVDVAFPDLKLAVEADGSSHTQLLRRQQDSKKTNLLTALGWTVLRFTNRRILEDTQNVKEELRSIILRLIATQVTA